MKTIEYYRKAKCLKVRGYKDKEAFEIMETEYFRINKHHKYNNSESFRQSMYRIRKLIE